MMTAAFRNGNCATNYGIRSTISTSDPNAPLISIRNAYKCFGSTIVFEGLDLTVQKGSIYCLLGPSGCGKTTLLNTIIGKSLLDYGELEFNIKKRSEFGFMPQAFCLYQNLTVNETFLMFGYIFGMSREHIQKKSKDLITFLHIPSGNRPLRTFSGGEQRRVSVAVTFLHNPKALILDEPTVGLDPILCENIWDYLVELSALGTTVVITTHYIQEASRSHAVGLMRNGKLLAEDKPLNLLQQYNTDNLEHVFLALSTSQQLNHIRKKQVSFKHNSRSQNIDCKRIKFDEDDRTFSTPIFSAINYKNAMILKHAYIFLIFLFLLPISQIIFFNLTIGRKPLNLPIAIVNDEMGFEKCRSSDGGGIYQNNSHCFLPDTSNSEGANGSSTLHLHENVYLSCMFIEVLRNETYRIVEFDNIDLALSSVKSNKVWGLLYFKHNYTRSLSIRMTGGMELYDWELKNSDVVAWLDLSNQYIGTFIKYDVVRFTTRILQRAFKDCNEDPRLGMLPPMTMQTPIYGSPDEQFVSYASSAVLCILSFFMPFLLTGGLIFVEKYSGILGRLMVAGVTMKEILTSILLLQVIVHCVQTMGVMFINYYVFDNPMHGNVLSLSLLLLIIGLSGSCFGLAVACISGNISMMAYTGIGANLLLNFTSGAIWPVEGHHYLLKSVQNFIPLTMAVKSIRSICARNLPIYHSTVIGGFIVQLGWTALFILIIHLVTKYRKNAWFMQT